MGESVHAVVVLKPGRKPAQVVIVKLSTHPKPAEGALFADAFAAMDAVAAAL